jgi:hypothetical protein
MKFVCAALIAFSLAHPQQENVRLPADGVESVVDVGVGVASFDFKRTGVQPPHWAVEVYADGTGRYDDLSAAEHASATTLRAIHVSPETYKRISAGADAVRAGRCESKQKNIANTGAKHIAYRWRAGDIWSKCDFNYSEDAALNDAAAAFQAIAETMQAGDKLKHHHRFDRLGLDGELDSLASAVKAGRAIELQNIAAVLQSLVNDDELMDVVRRKAQGLLQLAGVQAGK